MGVIFYGSGGKPLNHPPQHGAFFCPCGVKKLSLYQLRREKNKETNADLTEDQIRILYLLAKSSRGINNRILPTFNHRLRHTFDNSNEFTWGWLSSRRGYDLERLCSFLVTSVENRALWVRLIDNDPIVNEVAIEGLDSPAELQRDWDRWSDLFEDTEFRPRNHSPTYECQFELRSQSLPESENQASNQASRFTDYELFLFDQM